MKRSYRLVAPLTLAGLVLTPAFAQGHAHSHAAVPSFSYKATNGTFIGPKELPTGLVTLTLSNTDAAPHTMMLARLNDGVSMDQLQVALKEGPEAAMALVALAGGFGPTMPGQQNVITFDLKEAGNYVALDMMSGTVAPIAVVATGTTAARPQADLVVQMLDFGYDIPAEIGAGEQTWEVVNHGEEPHELILFKLQPGVTLDEVMKAMEENPEGEPPMEMVGGAMPMGVDYANFVKVDLKPGDYVAWCFIPSAANGGAPHFALGMAKPFRVVERAASN